LSPARVKASLHAEVSLHDDELFLKRETPDEVKEETLSAAESTHHDAERRAFFTNPIKVLEQGGDFGFAANLD
jgi:hypothetical protein